MHNPIRLDPLWWSTLVENKSLLHPHVLWRTVNCLVCAGGLPITWHGCAIGPDSVRVLPVPGAEEVPFIFSKLCFLCTTLLTTISTTAHVNSTILLLIQFRNPIRVPNNHTNQAIAKDQTCRYRLLGWWKQGTALKWLGFWGNTQWVPHQLGGT